MNSVDTCVENLSAENTTEELAILEKTLLEETLGEAWLTLANHAPDAQNADSVGFTDSTFAGSAEHTTLLRETWYYAVHSSELKPGERLAKTICEELILFGRDSDGKAFAISNICPHQGMPLDKGGFDGKEVSCCFHGWRFSTGGTCTAVPSFTEEQDHLKNHPSYCVKSYPVQEYLGTIWVYIGEKTENLPELIDTPGVDPNGFVGMAKNRLELPSHIDFGVIGLMDPAHVPFVHKSWWYSNAKRIYNKTKHFEPYRTGYRMVQHEPSKNATVYKLLGRFLETQINLELPGVRVERVSFKGHTLFTLVTALTPIDPTHTEMNHTTYWTFPPISLVTPFIKYFVHTFLNQDVAMAKLQQPLLHNKPKNFPKNLVMSIPDAGYPMVWYQQCKRAWALAAATGQPYQNPLQPRTLKWRS